MFFFFAGFARFAFLSSLHGASVAGFVSP